MKILAISCMHGIMPEGFKDYVKNNNIDIIISMGDHCNGDETRKIQFSNWDRFKGKEYYPTMKELLKDSYEKIFKDFATSGKNLLEELNSIGIPVLVLYGNNDFLETDKEKSNLNLPTLEETVEKLENLTLFDQETFEIDDFILAGIAGYRSFPRSMNFEDADINKIKEDAEELKEKLETIFKNKPSEKLILIGHDQPRNTDFDKVDYPSSPAHGNPVGDDILKEAIDKHQPKIYIGGHMHEHHGISESGKTTLVAAGHGRDGEFIVLNLPSLKVEIIKI